MSILNRGSGTRATHELHDTLQEIASITKELRDGPDGRANEPAPAKGNQTADETPPAEIKSERSTPEVKHHALPTEPRRPEKPTPPLPAENVAPPPMEKSGPEVRELLQQRETPTPRQELLNAPPRTSKEASDGRVVAPTMPSVINPPPVVLPAVTDISRQIEVFVATVSRNQQLTLSVLERTLPMFRAYESRLASIERELKRLEAVLTSSFRPF